MSHGTPGWSDPRVRHAATPSRRGRTLPVVRRVVVGLILFGGATVLGESVDAAVRSVHGIEVYRAHYCGACHTSTAAGTAGTFGPSHDGMGAIAAERLQDPAYAGTATTPEGYLRESILDPTAYLTPGYHHSTHAMPAYVHLSEEELAALVALLLEP